MTNGNKAYFIETLRCALTGEQLCPPFDGSSFSELYTLAKRQNLEAALSEALLTLSNIPPKRKAELEQNRLRAIHRYALLSTECESIQRGAKERGIRCMAQKGAVICKLYKKPHIRSMSDLDFLMDETALDSVTELMTSLGYVLEGTHERNHLNFSKTPDIQVEFHEKLLPYTVNDPYYSDPWTGTHVDDNGFTTMSDEQFYIYMILHAMQHFTLAGMGARFVMDAWVYLGAYGESMDMKLVHNELVRAGAADFEKGLTELCKVWFSGAEETALTKRMTDYVLEGGIYGAAVNREAAKVGQNGKAGHVLRTLFEPASAMKMLYPRLEKYPYLLPFYYPHRICVKIKNNRSQIGKRLNALRKADSVRVEEQKAMYRELGVDDKLR